MATLHGYSVNVGDIVYHYRFGPCIVKAICDAGIIIESEKRPIEHGPYDENGKLCKTDENPSIFWDRVIYEIPDKSDSKIDWSKVPEGTPVEVKDKLHDDWTKRIFLAFAARKTNSRFVTYSYCKNVIVSWKYCRLAPDVEVKEAWLK